MQVRSCAGCSAKSPVTNETWATSPRWPTPRSWSSSSRTDAPPRCDGLQHPRREAPTAAARQRPQTQPGKRKRRRNSTNSVLSNKQPLAPDEYCWCAAESVFKMTPLSLYVRTDSGSKRRNIWLLVRLPTPVEVVITDFKYRNERVLG